MLFQSIYDQKLAQSAYVIGCQRTGEAIVIDPQRDVDRYLQYARGKDLRITAIAETHVHADFLSGSRELAERTGGCLYLSGEGGRDWSYRWLDTKSDGGSYRHRLVGNGDTFEVGNVRFKVVHSPGHTPEHICFMVTDVGGGADEPMGIATGDFVFVGAVGRPDLLETAVGEKGVKEASARTLHQSLRRFSELPDFLQLWPGHGSGSACGKALGAVPQSTVGYEKRFNPFLRAEKGESEFVNSILSGQQEPPYYFGRMKRENRDGPALLGDLPEPVAVDIADLMEAVDQGAALLDTRSWDEFAARHLRGAMHMPLMGVFPTLAGSYVEAGRSVFLIVEASKVREAVIDLVHVGLDDMGGYATPDDLHVYASVNGVVMETTPHLDMGDLRLDELDERTVILDVRRADEFADGHLPGAVNIAHTRLFPRLGELPRNHPILVHCLSGLRSSYAVGMLQSFGYRATQLDGGFARWREVDGAVLTEKAAPVSPV